MDRPTKSVLLIVFAALSVVAIVLASMPPAMGFENTIYEQYPLWFWIIYVIGLSTSFISLLSKKFNHPYYFVGSIFAYYFVLYVIPIIRRYKVHGRGTSDLLVHIGEVKSILATGNVTTFYPMTHISLSVLSFWIRPEIATLILSFTWAFILLMFVGLSIKSITGDYHTRESFFIALPLSFATFHTEVHPAFVTTAMIPMIVYLIWSYTKIGKTRRDFILTIIISFVVIGHPLTAILIALLMISTYALQYASGSLRTAWSSTLQISFIPFVFATIVWGIWYTSTSQLGFIITDRISSLTGPGAETGAHAVQVSQQAGDPLLFLARRALERYGSTLLPISLASFLLFLYGLRIKFKFKRTTGPWIFVGVQFVIGIALSIFFLTFHFSGSHPIRVSRYALIMGLLVAGVALIEFRDSNQFRNKLIVGIIVATILSSAIIGVFAVYTPNKHMTEMEYTGIEATIEFRGDQTPIRSHDISSKSYRYVVGTHQAEWPSPIRLDSRHSIPENFGYNQSNRTGRILGESLLVTKKYDIARADAFSDHQKNRLMVYNETDLENLRQDPSANRVYANGEYQVWRSYNKS